MASDGDPEPLRAGVSEARRVSDDGRPPEVRQAALRCAGFETRDRHLRESPPPVSSDYTSDSRRPDRGQVALQKTLGRVDTHGLQIRTHFVEGRTMNLRHAALIDAHFVSDFPHGLPAQIVETDHHLITIRESLHGG